MENKKVLCNIIIDLAQKGFYQKEIAKILDIYPNKIVRILKKANLKWIDISTEIQKNRHGKTISENKLHCKGMIGSANPSYKEVDIDKVIALAELNYTQEEVAEYFGVSEGTICKKLRKTGCKWQDISDYKQSNKYSENQRKAAIDKRRKKEIDVDAIISLAKEGHTLTQISEYFNVCKSTIQHRLKENNIKWKSISDCIFSGIRNPRYKEIDINIIIQLAKENYTLKEVSERVNVYSTTIQNKLKQVGLMWSNISAYKKSSEYSKNKRKAKIKYMDSLCGQITPNYNYRACIFFENLNKAIGWQGMHAENGDEFYIPELGYWVDYYEPNLNLVIEWDEKCHYNSDGLLREKDVRREKEITEFLHCAFIRIKEEDLASQSSLLSQFACGIL